MKLSERLGFLLSQGIVKRVINEFLKGSLGILENFNWNMLLRKSA